MGEVFVSVRLPVNPSAVDDEVGGCRRCPVMSEALVDQVIDSRKSQYLWRDPQADRCAMSIQHGLDRTRTGRFKWRLQGHHQHGSNSGERHLGSDGLKRLRSNSWGEHAEI